MNSKLTQQFGIKASVTQGFHVAMSTQLLNVFINSVIREVILSILKEGEL